MIISNLTSTRRAESGMSITTTVHHKIKKALELGYKPSCSVPFRNGVEQAEQFKMKNIQP